jgi:hypothetical protein
VIGDKMNNVVLLLFSVLSWIFFYSFAFERRILIRMTFNKVDEMRLLNNENFIAKCHMGAFTSGIAAVITTIMLVSRAL